MNNRAYEIRTPAKGARVGNRAIVDGRIVLRVKAGKQEDYITPEQLIEALIGVPVKEIVFQDGGIIDRSEQ